MTTGRINQVTSATEGTPQKYEVCAPWFRGSTSEKISQASPKYFTLYRLKMHPDSLPYSFTLHSTKYQVEAREHLRQIPHCKSLREAPSRKLKDELRLLLKAIHKNPQTYKLLIEYSYSSHWLSFFSLEVSWQTVSLR